MKPEKLLTLLWSFSLMAVGLCSLVLSLSNLLSFPLPDLITRVIGIVNLVSLPLLVYSSVRKGRHKSSDTKPEEP